MPDLSDPQSAAEMLLARAFDFAAAGVQPDIQVRDGFWNITYTDRDSYVVEIDRDLPYPKTLYAFVRVPPGGWEEPELHGPAGPGLPEGGLRRGRRPGPGRGVPL